ncbi:MAG: polyprenyl synthetase family protein [Betaproteobacteria bacterium]|nr:polyprenyl synthetase family protein [Betaproteobacteria bacterium]
MPTLPFLAPVAADLQRVDEVIRARLDSDVVLVRQVAEYIIAAGGKRLRPALLLLAADAVGYRGEARFGLAAVIEFIHTATLLHDDVVDESQLRRGRRTANAAFGNAASVLVGDFLYSRAFQMMVAVDSMRVMQVLADATNTIAEGEVLQLLNCHNADVDEARYLEVIRRKTAKLFEAAARLGGALGGVAPDVEEGLADYGMHVGTAFQLIDDVLDYSGDAHEIGKSLGDDLAEGKPTLPLIRAMSAGTPQQVALVRRAIVEGGRAEFPQVLGAIEATGALAYAREVAGREADAARRAIGRLPHSGRMQSLLELAAFSVTRSH